MFTPLFVWTGSYTSFRWLHIGLDFCWNIIPVSLVTLSSQELRHPQRIHWETWLMTSGPPMTFAMYDAMILLMLRWKSGQQKHQVFMQHEPWIVGYSLPTSIALQDFWTSTRYHPQNIKYFIWISMQPPIWKMRGVYAWLLNAHVTGLV